MQKYLAIIPARFGSKGIPYKNLLKIDGTSLVERAIKSAINSIHNLDIVLSSDSEEILKEADKFSITKHMRKPHHASDKATTASVVQDIILSLDRNYSHILVLQPTSPFRTHDHIDQAIKTLSEHKDCDGLVSVYEEDKDILKSFYLNNLGYIKGTFSDDAPFAPRQSLPNVYKANGAIFIVRNSVLMKKAKLYGSKMIPYIMDKKSSIDIDSLDDLSGLDYELYTPS